MGDEAVREYLHREGPRGVWGSLWLCVNPFTRLDGWNAMAVGLFVVAGTVAVAIGGHVHFDGVMDLHVGRITSAWFFAYEALADWLIVALIFWAGAAIFARKTKPRALDFFGMLGVGRLPFLMSGLLFLPGLLGGLMDEVNKVVQQGLAHPDQLMSQLLAMPGFVWLVVGIGVMMAIFLWGMFLNYFAVREASGMEIGPAVGLFIGGTILAEIVSKVAILGVLYFVK
jgi:hypothetical protein